MRVTVFLLHHHEFRIVLLQIRLQNVRGYGVLYFEAW